MAQKNNGKDRQQNEPRLHRDVKKSIAAVIFLAAAIVLLLAGFDKAGPAGEFIFKSLSVLFGVGYWVLPFGLFGEALIFLLSDRKHLVGITVLGLGLFILACLGLIETVLPDQGGWLGNIFGSFRLLFGKVAAIIINVAIVVIGALITLNAPIKFKRKPKDNIHIAEIVEPALASVKEAKAVEEKKENKPIAKDDEKEEPEIKEGGKTGLFGFGKTKKTPIFQNYVPPPLDLLKSGTDKPSVGDLRANANIIKRTLDSFGIPVEMGEINIGPKVTRYTLKPAEGVKLSRITALNQDLSLALAAHPIRIEAPIPGKSLVGIEVPNKAAALVRLGSLMAYPEFQGSGALSFVLGRDVTGEPVFTDIEKMPHLLIAGATGSGKSVAIHSLLVSLLYKNSPATLKLVLIDPKRVELSMYENMPHLVGPVVTESKKSLGVFRWAIGEMDRRYDLLLKAGSRDIKSYNQSHPKEILPFVLVVVDEMADLMTTFGREVEGFIVRLAQMARATGLHLVLSTQRPSVEVITGLIKANITSRIALQVASQIDSRTILDTSGAEKLLGGGDLLLVSSENSKPRRIQCAYISEDEIKKVTDFIREHNALPEEEEKEEAAFEEQKDGSGSSAGQTFDDYADDERDELYRQAVETVMAAKKASASLLQRRLKVGYARAARLLDIMEEDGVIGPGDGAKPREVYPDASSAPAAEENHFS